MAALGAACAGCHSPPRPDPADPYVRIRTHYPQESWRFRWTEGSDLPPGVVRPLCDEYQVFEVTDPRRWRELCEAFHLDGVAEEPDFARGTVVGLAGTLGRPISGHWPMYIEYISLRHGVGSLAVGVDEGLYLPLRSSPYCVLTYVPDLKRLAIVRVNHRLFYLD